MAEERSTYVVLRPARPRFVVKKEGERFRVIGRGVETWVSETDLEDPEKLARLQRRLVKEGVERELASAGARRGDEVVIGDVAFEYLPEGGRDGDGVRSSCGPRPRAGRRSSRCWTRCRPIASNRPASTPRAGPCGT